MSGTSLTRYFTPRLRLLWTGPISFLDSVIETSHLWFQHPILQRTRRCAPHSVGTLNILWLFKKLLIIKERFHHEAFLSRRVASTFLALEKALSMSLRSEDLVTISSNVRSERKKGEK
jgi:hypothetical protein